MKFPEFLTILLALYGQAGPALVHSLVHVTERGEGKANGPLLSSTASTTVEGITHRA
jgi:hypothetical protein